MICENFSSTKNIFITNDDDDVSPITDDLINNQSSVSNHVQSKNKKKDHLQLVHDCCT
jgi:hypothetical protein